jgi:rhamnose transport system ATP-binding protein
MNATTTPILSLDHASKSFGAIHALEDVSIHLQRGEAHALVGENGAGKSTLVKILAGVQLPDRGSVRVDGVDRVLASPVDARAAGIAIIYQEPVQFPDLTVAENIFVGRQPLRAGRRIDRRAMNREAAQIFERLGVQLDPARIARGLSIAEQQIVEIAKALSLDARILVMDEPTSSLTAAESGHLFEIVRQLRDEGLGIVYISHRLNEIIELAEHGPA